jgi:hypothetical protein
MTFGSFRVPVRVPAMRKSQTWKPEISKFYGILTGGVPGRPITNSYLGFHSECELEKVRGPAIGPIIWAVNVSNGLLQTLLEEGIKSMARHLTTDGKVLQIQVKFLGLPRGKEPWHQADYMSGSMNARGSNGSMNGEMLHAPTSPSGI